MSKQNQFKALWDLFEKHPEALITMAKHGTNVDLVELHRLKESNDG